MKVGSIVKVVIPPTDDIEYKGEVEKGALAICVNGKETFPLLYKELEEKIGKAYMEEFVWVEWLREDYRYKGRVDGAYSMYRFAEVLPTHNASVLN